MTDYIKCETKEDCGAIVHVVTWTVDKTLGKASLTQKIYDNAFYGPSEAIRDAASRLNVKIDAIVYGLHGYTAARILGK